MSPFDKNKDSSALGFKLMFFLIGLISLLGWASNLIYFNIFTPKLASFFNLTWIEMFFYFPGNLRNLYLGNFALWLFSFLIFLPLKALSLKNIKYFLQIYLWLMSLLFSLCNYFATDWWKGHYAISGRAFFAFSFFVAVTLVVSSQIFLISLNKKVRLLAFFIGGVVWILIMMPLGSIISLLWLFPYAGLFICERATDFENDTAEIRYKRNRALSVLTILVLLFSIWIRLDKQNSSKLKDPSFLTNWRLLELIELFPTFQNDSCTVGFLLKRGMETEELSSYFSKISRKTCEAPTWSYVVNKKCERGPSINSISVFVTKNGNYLDQKISAQTFLKIRCLPKNQI